MRKRQKRHAGNIQQLRHAADAAQAQRVVRMLETAAEAGRTGSSERRPGGDEGRVPPTVRVPAVASMGRPAARLPRPLPVNVVRRVRHHDGEPRHDSIGRRCRDGIPRPEGRALPVRRFGPRDGAARRPGCRVTDRDVQGGALAVPSHAVRALARQHAAVHRVDDRHSQVRLPRPATSDPEVGAAEAVPAQGRVGQSLHGRSRRTPEVAARLLLRHSDGVRSLLGYPLLPCARTARRLQRLPRVSGLPAVLLRSDGQHGGRGVRGDARPRRQAGVVRRPGEVPARVRAVLRGVARAPGRAGRHTARRHRLLPRRPQRARHRLRRRRLHVRRRTPPPQPRRVPPEGARRRRLRHQPAAADAHAREQPAEHAHEHAPQQSDDVAVGRRC